MAFGWGLGRVSASTATTLSLLEPAAAAVLAVLVVGEQLPALGWTGIALIFGSLIVLTAPVGTLRSAKTVPDEKQARQPGAVAVEPGVE
jgi:DME family drug/metabolite transporter